MWLMYVAAAAVIFIFACKQQSLQGSHPWGLQTGGYSEHIARPKTISGNGNRNSHISSSSSNILYSKLSRGAKNPNNIDEQTSLAVNELCLWFAANWQKGSLPPDGQKDNSFREWLVEWPKTGPWRRTRRQQTHTLTHYIYSFMQMPRQLLPCSAFALLANLTTIFGHSAWQTTKSHSPTPGGIQRWTEQGRPSDTGHPPWPATPQTFW